MTTDNRGPQDLAARFNFGGSQRSREDRIRAERLATLEALRPQVLATDDQELAFEMVRQAPIGTLAKRDLKNEWRRQRGLEEVR